VPPPWTASSRVASAKQRPVEIAEIREVFKDVDAFVTPTHLFVAPPLTVDAEANPGARQFTMPVSFTRFPAISVPCGLTRFWSRDAALNRSAGWE